MQNFAFEPHTKDPIKVFASEVAKWVMTCMNQYYQYNSNKDTCIRKISDKYEYQRLAKEFSRDIRREEKESYLLVHGTLDGLEMNLDIKCRIKSKLEMFFDSRPLLT